MPHSPSFMGIDMENANLEAKEDTRDLWELDMEHEDETTFDFD